MKAISVFVNMNESSTNTEHRGSQTSPSPNIIPILFSFSQIHLPKWRWSIFWGGQIKDVIDNDINSSVKEISGPWISSVCITCPADPKETLDITLPFLFIVMKNMNKGFAFEAHVLDDKGVTREFYVATNRSMIHWSLQRCQIPLRLENSWNKITMDLAYHTRLIFSSRYVRTQCVKVYANCRVRQIYFADRIYTNQEHPDGYKLHLPVCKNSTSLFSKDSSDLE